MKRKIDYEVILKKVNWLIQSKPQSTSEKEFVTQFSGVLSVAEAKRFWNRLLAHGELFLKAVDNKRYEWKVNANFFTRDSIEKHFRQGDVLSTRGRIPGKKYPPKAVKEKKPDKTELILWHGWTSTISI